MKNTVSLLVAASLVLAGAARGSAACPELSADEKKAGWVPLFDGTTMKGWHGYNGQDRKSVV